MRSLGNPESDLVSSTMSNLHQLNYSLAKPGLGISNLSISALQSFREDQFQTTLLIYFNQAGFYLVKGAQSRYFELF